jgi:RHS repeat-associated protein
VDKARNRRTPKTIAEYRYNGLGFRTGTHTDTNADGLTDVSDPWYHLTYNERWQHVATFRDTDADPKERYIHNAAGLAGRASSSYIDSVILRDRDIAGWTAAASETLDERTYLLQNWRADVVAAATLSGDPIEYTRYSPYGTPSCYVVADVNRDGVVDASDDTDWNTGTPQNAAKITGDLNRDGVSNSTDASFYTSNKASGRVGGYLKQSSIGLTRGYAGYVWDPYTKMNHVRHRVYSAEFGRWTRRDPLGYVDGVGLYEYVSSEAISERDYLGLFCSMTVGCGGGHQNGTPPDDRPRTPRNPRPRPRWVEGCAANASSRQDCQMCCHYNSDGQNSPDSNACAANCDRLPDESTPQTQPNMSQCLNKSQSNSDITTCSTAYQECECLYGVNIRCMCQCMDTTSQWSNFVRACLQCMHRIPGVNWVEAHRQCKTAADTHFGLLGNEQSLIGCIIWCRAMQAVNCKGLPCEVTIASF